MSGTSQCPPAHDARRRERTVGHLSVAVARREVHEGLPREVRKSHPFLLGERVTGADHPDERHSGQLPCVDPGGLAFGKRQEGHVQVPAEQRVRQSRRAGRRQPQPDVDRRMPRVQLPQERRQVHYLDRGHGAHVHRAAQRVLCGTHGVLGRLGGVQGGPGLRKQRRARPREPDLLGRALEQHAAELALQGPDRGGHP